MSNADKSSKKKYPFGKNNQESIIYKQYFISQARKNNTTLKQYEKDCIKRKLDYKVVCNSWKTILGDIPKKKFDDPSVCELSNFKDKQLDKMSLDELNFYYRQIRDIIIIIQDCVTRRTEFKEKCIPSEFQDSGHETRIENVIKLKSHCDSQLSKIALAKMGKNENTFKNPWKK